jgi:hypothetical protein
LAPSFLSLPLFLLAWLPCLKLCQRVKGNLLSRTPSRCWFSSLNQHSSAALLDRSPDNVYTLYVCNPSEVPLVRHYVVAPVLLHWCRGAVALWRRGIMELWRHAYVVLVFFDWYDYTTLRSASVVFIDNVSAGTFSCTQSSRV